MVRKFVNFVEDMKELLFLVTVLCIMIFLKY